MQKSCQLLIPTVALKLWISNMAVNTWVWCIHLYCYPGLLRGKKVHKRNT